MKGGNPMLTALIVLLASIPAILILLLVVVVLEFRALRRRTKGVNATGVMETPRRSYPTFEQACRRRPTDETDQDPR
jgi:TRAP-type uncharacterized transport system fused permease subunit